MLTSFIVNCDQESNLVLLEGAFGKGYLGSIGELLYVPL